MQTEVQVFEDQSHIETLDDVIEPEFTVDLRQEDVVLEEATAASVDHDDDHGRISMTDLRCEVLQLASAMTGQFKVTDKASNFMFKANRKNETGC